MQKKRVAVAMWAFSLPQMLKGCADGVTTSERNDALGIWLLAIALGVILLWEGAKTVVRPCLRAVYVDSDRMPVQVTLNVDPGRDSPSSHEHEPPSPNVGSSQPVRRDCGGASGSRHPQARQEPVTRPHLHRPLSESQKPLPHISQRQVRGGIRIVGIFGEE